ncbi:hypothetical protein MTO96_028080 [Rhipicephalus appendiculatus]
MRQQQQVDQVGRDLKCQKVSLTPKNIGNQHNDAQAHLPLHSCTCSSRSLRVRGGDFSEDHVSESVIGPDSHPHPQARARLPAPATAHGMPIGETGAGMAVFVCQKPLKDPGSCALSRGTCFSREE